MNALCQLPGGRYFHCTRCDRRGYVSDSCRRCDGTALEPCDLVGCLNAAEVDEGGVGFCEAHAGKTVDEVWPGEPTTPTPVVPMAVLVGTIGEHGGEGDGSAHPAFDPNHWCARVLAEVSR